MYNWKRLWEVFRAYSADEEPDPPYFTSEALDEIDRQTSTYERILTNEAISHAKKHGRDTVDTLDVKHAAERARMPIHQ